LVACFVGGRGNSEVCVRVNEREGSNSSSREESLAGGVTVSISLHSVLPSSFFVVINEIFFLFSDLTKQTYKVP